MTWFNGGLFDNDTALPLETAKITTVLETVSLDWADIDPAILGTLFERGLDPDKRSQLGAHYTDRDMIMRIIEPVVTAPWLAEWETTKEDILPSAIACRHSVNTRTAYPFWCIMRNGRVAIVRSAMSAA